MQISSAAWLRAPVLLMVGVLFMAGCGDDTEPDVAPTTTSSAAAATSSTRSASSTTTSVAVTAKCTTVGFTANSEDAASDIEATGLSCAEAEAFVRIAGTRTSSGGPQEVEVEGYRCVRTRTEQDPLPQAFYECVNGTRNVRYVRS